MLSRPMISRPPHTQNTKLHQQEEVRTGKQSKQSKSQQAIMHRGGHSFDGTRPFRDKP